MAQEISYKNGYNPDGDRMSLAEFFQSEYFTGEERWELSQGVLVAMSPSRPRNSSTAVVLSHLFMSALEKSGRTCTVYGADLGVKMESLGSFFIPDVTVVCDRSKIGETMCEDAPELVVEVLSPSTRKYDLSVKRRLYKRGGVKEAWFVDVDSKSVIVEHFDTDETELFGGEGMVESFLFDEFKFSAREIFRD
jgi:Uma2 family endonuclease